jgi:hypothetical protein
MPGDDKVPKASFNGTRAATIDASPELVWPWIVQMGYRRAGFYGGARSEGLPNLDPLLQSEAEAAPHDEVGGHDRQAVQPP